MFHHDVTVLEDNWSIRIVLILLELEQRNVSVVKTHSHETVLPGDKISSMKYREH